MPLEVLPARQTKVALSAFPGLSIQYTIPASLASACASSVDRSEPAPPHRIDVAVLPWVLASESPDRVSASDGGSAPADASPLEDLLRHVPPPDLEDWIRRCRRATGFDHARVRTGFTWVGGPSPDAAWLVPPAPELIDGLLTDLGRFLAARPFNTLEELLVLAYQLIHIHPFADGNGRLARSMVLMASTAGSQPGTGRWLALAMSCAKDHTAEWMLQLRKGDLSQALSCCREALEGWLEVRRRSETRLKELLDEAFSAPHLQKRASELQRILLAGGRITDRQLLRHCGNSPSLVAKYKATMLRSTLWAEDSSGVNVPEVIRVARNAVMYVAQRTWDGALG